MLFTCAANTGWSSSTRQISTRSLEHLGVGGPSDHHCGLSKRAFMLPVTGDI
jgi:hypothetical protein